MSFRVLTAFGPLGALVSAPVLAGSCKFMLHNGSKYPVTGLQTYEDDKWSGVDVGLGESQEMNWNTDKGDCVVPFRIIYKDVETEQYKVVWCKISNIRVHDDSATTERSRAVAQPRRLRSDARPTDLHPPLRSARRRSLVCPPWGRAAPCFGDVTTAPRAAQNKES